MSNQPLGGRSLQATQHSIHRIEKNRFSGSGFAGEHGETLLEIELKTVDQGNVLESQPGQHGSARWFNRP
jgi:hypothetical protein